MLPNGLGRSELLFAICSALVFYIYHSSLEYPRKENASGFEVIPACMVEIRIAEGGGVGKMRARATISIPIGFESRYEPI